MHFVDRLSAGLVVGLALLFSVSALAKEKQRVIQAGEHSFPEGLVVAENEVLVIRPGARLKMGAKSQILVKGRIVAVGSKDKPIVFEGADTYWRGIRIDGLADVPDVEKFWGWMIKENKKVEKEFFDTIQKGSVLKYCQIKNTATQSRKFSRRNKWKAAVEAYNTSLHVSHADFSDILYFGGVLTQRSMLLIDNSRFESDTLHKGINTTDRNVGVFFKNQILQERKRGQRCADGIWVQDGSIALASDNLVQGVGDDGIDVESSRVVLYQNKVIKAMDDGLDIDTKSTAFLLFNSIEGVKDNGILISDWSEGFAMDNKVSGSKSGLALRNGSQVMGCEQDLNKNETGILAYQSFPCAMTSADYLKVKEALSKATEEQIDEAGIKDVSNVKQLLEFYAESYEKTADGKFWVLVREDVEKEVPDMDELFKLTDVLSLDFDSTKGLEAGKFCESLTNKLYLISSRVRDNKQDVSSHHRFKLNFEEVEFTKPVEYGNSGFTCEAGDKTMVEGILVNARKIGRHVDEFSISRKK